jgi:hypothetical protein
MAALAVGPELAVVDVAGFVAVRAVATEFRVPVKRPAVTGLTGDLAVCTGQCKVGPAVVIERGFLPSDRVVAESTAVAEEALVGVIFVMTVSAVFRRVPEDMRVMAGIAFGIIMLPE